MRSYLYVPDDRSAEIVEPGGYGTGRGREWIRFDPAGAGDRGVRDVVRPGLAGVCPTGMRSAAELAALAAVLAEAEEAIGLPVGRVPVMPAVDSAEAVLAVDELARAPRVVRLLLTEAELRAELRLDPGPDERELLWVRSMVVVASAAAGIRPPVADVCPVPGAFRASTEGLRRLGFGGRVCRDEEELAAASEIFAKT